MSESLTRQLKITKQAVRGKGVVVAQNCRAAEVGAEILRKGGNAIDAAVATGMAIGALEPWMSGIGGVGFMTIWSAKEKRAWTVDYGPISARKLDPRTTRSSAPAPPIPSPGPTSWSSNNEVGYHSIAVPGMVAGLGKALERFGTMKWKDVLAPGVALAERGMELDWYMQVMIANGARASVEVPGVEGHLSVRRRPRADATTGRAPSATSSSAISARPCAGWPRAARANSTKAAWRATSRPTCRPAARRSPTRISRLLRGAHRRAAVVRASRRHRQRRGRPDRRPDLAPHARARGRAHQRQGRARRRLLRRHRRGHAHGLSRSA